jgi:hypothetical protein
MHACISTARTGTIESQPASHSQRERPGQAGPAMLGKQESEARGFVPRTWEVRCVRVAGEATTLHYSAGGGTGTRGHSLMAKGQKGPDGRRGIRGRVWPAIGDTVLRRTDIMSEHGAHPCPSCLHARMCRVLGFRPAGHFYNLLGMCSS